MSDNVPLRDEDRARLAEGDTTAILKLLSDIFPAWGAVDEQAIRVDALTGGYSGAAVFKVAADSSGILPLLLRMPGNHGEDPAIELFFKTSDPWIPAAAQRAWGAHPRHASLLYQDNMDAPNVCITEFIVGSVGDATLMNGPEARHYAAALGNAVGELHGLDSQWFDQGLTEKLGRDEQAVAIDSVENETTKQRIVELGSYQRFGRSFIDILVTEHLTEGDVEGVAQLGEAIFGLLDPNSLMGRLVVGHGDLKYDNTMIRSASTSANPDLVLIDYDRVMRLPAAADLGCYLHDPEPRSKKYPSLANRRALAKGYRDACIESGMDMREFRETEIDDIVLAMEAGLLIRSLWLSTIMTTLFPQYRWVVPVLREGLARAAKLLLQAKTDIGLREKILLNGSSKSVGKGFAVPLLFRTALQALKRRGGLSTPSG